MEFDNAMRRHVYSLPSLLRHQYDDLEPKTREILSTPEIFSMQRIVLTGCGDSYAAAMATRYAFEGLTGIPTEVVTAIDLARYYDEGQLGFSPQNPFVFAVSNSGKVARISEAMERMVKHGAFALAITGNENSPLAQSSSRTLKLNVPQFESAPGTRSYLVAILALLLMAIRIGEVRGRYTMDAATAIRKEIPMLAKSLECSLDAMDSGALALAKQWKNLDAFDFAGSGQDYAASWFGQAKVFEAIGWHAMHINTEEWLHMNFFMSKPEKIATVIVYSGGSAAKSRTAEMLGYAEGMGRPLLIVTDAPEELPIKSSTCITLPQTDCHWLQPLVQFIPICLVVGYIGEMLGEKEGRGCQGPWAFAKGAAAIRNSETIIL